MIMEQFNVRLRLMEREDFRSLWQLCTPEIFEYMLTKVETYGQLADWLEAGLGKADSFLL